MDPAKLKAEGWERRSVADEPRLSEIVALYRELGLEVLLLPVLSAKDGEGCVECFAADADPARFKIVYTRER